MKYRRHDEGDRERRRPREGEWVGHGEYDDRDEQRRAPMGVARARDVTGVPVTVVVDGAIIAGSTAARLRNGVVVAPLDPYVRSFATRISYAANGSIVVERSGTVVTLEPDSNVERAGTTIGRVIVVRGLPADRTMIPLASVARGLGATVTYDARSHTVAVVLASGGLRPPVPFVAGTVAPDAPHVFAPTATPQPTPTVGAMPRPRRTPIEIDPPRGTLPRSWEERAHG